MITLTGRSFFGYVRRFGSMHFILHRRKKGPQAIPKRCQSGIFRVYFHSKRAIDTVPGFGLGRCNQPQVVI